MGYVQGTYNVKNKDKYVGTKEPRYLSSWELKVFEEFDRNPMILQWGSEPVVIKYFSSADNKYRRYMVDIFVKYKKSDGTIVKELIEIKPYIQTQPPQAKKGKRKQTLLKEIYTYNVNMDKWKAAVDFCKKRNIGFRIITEKDIFK